MTHIPVATAQRIIQSFYGTCPEDLSYLGGADSGIPLEFTGSEWVTTGSAGAATIATASANMVETDGTVSFDCLVSFMVGVDPAIDKYYHVTAVRDEASMFGFHLVSVEEVAAVEGLTL